MFDLHELCPDNEGKGSIKAVFTPKLKIEVLQAMNRTRNTMKLKDFCKNNGIHYTTLWDYLNRRKAIPLFLLKELDNPEVNFQEHIMHLEYGAGSTKRQTKAIKNMSEDLAKIIGAFVADGHLKQRDTMWGDRKSIHYELVYREGYKTNINALARWLRDTFGIKVKPTKDKNCYSIYISNKIIFRYFQNLFGFTPGRKTATVRVPDIIKESPDNIKKYFAWGVIMFDGSVSRVNGYIELYSRSRNLIKDMSKLLESLNLCPDYVSKKSDKYKRWRLIIRKQEKLKRSLCLFEPQTEKWIRLNKRISKFSC